jgi:hypoxanthine phosphoribosyltransferase
MFNDLECTLLNEKRIRDRIAELGKEIARDYAGEPLLLIGVLKGAFIFMADLVRAISIPLSLDFVAVSSYGSSTKSTGVVRILKDLDYPVAGSNLLVVEDIVDSGLTLSYLRKLFLERGPKSLKLCAFLDKPERREVSLAVDYVGFTIPNEFVVGYGLDYNGGYRNLPFVAKLKTCVYTKSSGERL